jgi:uncharacterized protein YggE
MSTNLTVSRPQRLGWLAGGALVSVLGAMLIAPTIAPALAQGTTEVTKDHTLSVTGTGIVTVKPDTADVTVGVTTQRDTAAAAAGDAANVMDAVIKAIKALGIEDKDIQTSSLSLNGVYDYSNNTPRLTGYQAVNQVTVTVRDISKTGAVIDAATGAGATDVNSIVFRLDDQVAAEAAAREQAVLSARAKADTIAKAAGVEITGVISIAETGAPVPTPMYFDSAKAAGVAMDSAPTPVQGGTIDLTVDVSVVYSIP